MARLRFKLSQKLAERLAAASAVIFEKSVLWRRVSVSLESRVKWYQHKDARYK